MELAAKSAQELTAVLFLKELTAEFVTELSEYLIIELANEQQITAN